MALSSYKKLKSKHASLKTYKNWDKLSCLSLSIFLWFWGNKRRQKPKYSLPKKQLEFEIEDTDDAACVEKMFLADQKQIEDNFQKLDIDGDGQIDISEI